MICVIDGIKVRTNVETADENELRAYIEHTCKSCEKATIDTIDVTFDGDFVDLKTTFKRLPPFERIRRITGYLVGTLERFNDAKHAEVVDRISHDCSCHE